MLIQLNFKSGLPVYLQIVEQVKAAIASGILRPGESLPSIRPLAEDLRINRNTVAKAYAELENQGVIETAAGKGSFIKDSQTPYRKEVRRQLLAGAVDAAIVQAYHLQFTPAEVLELVRDRLGAFEQKNPGHALKN